LNRQSIYGIRDVARSSGRSVFNAQELANLIGSRKEYATVYMSRLVARHLATKLIRGRISFSDNDLVIATQLYEPSYVSLDSALLFHGLRKQVPRNVQCVYTGNSLVLSRYGIEYHKIASALFFGYKRHTLGDSYALVAEPEKALLDGYYLGLYTFDDLEEFSGSLHFDTLTGQVERFNGRGSRKMKEALALLTASS
jgi:predicted transcriptional regulator of viral defense system